MVTEKTKEAVREYLLGSCKYKADVAEDFPELDEDTDLILSIVVEMGIDWCEQCGWCFEVCELDNDPHEMICDNCYEENNPEDDE